MRNSKNEKRTPNADGQIAQANTSITMSSSIVRETLDENVAAKAIDSPHSSSRNTPDQISMPDKHTYDENPATDYDTSTTAQTETIITSNVSSKLSSQKSNENNISSFHNDVADDGTNAEDEVEISSDMEYSDAEYEARIPKGGRALLGRRSKPKGYNRTTVEGEMVKFGDGPAQVGKGGRKLSGRI